MAGRQIDIPRLVVAGTHSGVGKTTAATALMGALARRGLRVQPFKIGPDFIDPSFHRAATGRISRNLDGWMLSRETNADIFARGCEHADIAVVEGVMGLLDGHDAVSDEGSTAQLAKWLDAPVLLVVDASAMARSMAAVVQGFENFDPALRLAGVLFNRVAGEAHYELLRRAIEHNCRAMPLGYLTDEHTISFPDRHLGLVMADEWLTEARIEALVRWIERHAELDRVIDLARSAPPFRAPSLPQALAGRTACVRVGVARDHAFCFYYQDNLDLLRHFGCELVEFSPIDAAGLPPDLDGLYIGGGYPELHAAELAANGSMLESIRQFARRGSPIYAECGGFMYLTEAIVDLQGLEHKMAGIFPTKARMQPRLAALGYVEIKDLFEGMRARGHEFRYSTIDEMPPQIARAYLIGDRLDGYRAGSVVGSYVHLHFASCPALAANFTAACKKTNEKHSA